MTTEHKPHPGLPTFIDWREPGHATGGGPILTAGSYLDAHPDPELLLVFSDIDRYMDSYPCSCPEDGGWCRCRACSCNCNFVPVPGENE